MSEANMLVFVVDDEESIVNSLCRVLKLEGCDVLGFSNGHDALAHANAKKPSLILCDQRMPNEKGTNILSKFKELSPKTYRVIISGYSDFNVLISPINSSLSQGFDINICTSLELNASITSLKSE